MLLFTHFLQTVNTATREDDDHLHSKKKATTREAFLDKKCHPNVTEPVIRGKKPELLDKKSHPTAVTKPFIPGEKPAALNETSSQLIPVRNSQDERFEVGTKQSVSNIRLN